MRNPKSAFLLLGLLAVLDYFFWGGDKLHLGNFGIFSNLFIVYRQIMFWPQIKKNHFIYV